MGDDDLGLHGGGLHGLPPPGPAEPSPRVIRPGQSQRTKAALKWRPFTVTRFLGNTGAAPKQAHRMRAVDAEFIGFLTMIDRFPPTAPDRFCPVRGAFTPFSPEIVSRLGNWYDCSGLCIHGVVRG